MDFFSHGVSHWCSSECDVTVYHFIRCCERVSVSRNLGPAGLAVEYVELCGSAMHVDEIINYLIMIFTFYGTTLH